VQKYINRSREMKRKKKKHVHFRITEESNNILEEWSLKLGITKTRMLEDGIILYHEKMKKITNDRI
jgi:hypothetical protein